MFHRSCHKVRKACDCRLGRFILLMGGLKSTRQFPSAAAAPWKRTIGMLMPEVRTHTTAVKSISPGTAWSVGKVSHGDECVEFIL